MKKIVSLAILGLAAVVLILGLASCFATYAMLNPKDNIATYAKDGRRIVYEEVDEEYEDKYVEKSDVELIRESTRLKRLVKYNKILMNEAKEMYDDEEIDLEDYNDAVAEYKQSKVDRRTHSNALFVTCMSSFSSYILIIGVLVIGFVVNTKIDYSRKDS